jgi:hypothetical protein
MVQRFEDALLRLHQLSSLSPYLSKTRQATLRQWQATGSLGTAHMGMSIHSLIESSNKIK